MCEVLWERSLTCIFAHSKVNAHLVVGHGLCEKSLPLHSNLKMLGFLLLNICNQFLEEKAAQVHSNSC